MKINIASSHRFHLLDLARELEKQGNTVRFYSYVPTRRALKFGLKRKSSYSIYYLMIPFLALQKIPKCSNISKILTSLILDYYLAFFMKPCDVYIALGTVYNYSLKRAKRKYNVTTILEWGSKHINEQESILSKKPGRNPKSNTYFKERSLKGYVNADYIAIASDHVKESFIKNGVLENKLIQNSYGVDLNMFHPTKINHEYGRIFDLILVGGWSYRKGCDLLLDVCRRYKLSLLHVGSIVDLPFPKDANLTHIDSVDQSQLIRYYERARVFVLPSREEGLAMVQAQAIICGLPIVCSKDSGGRDLAKLLNNDKSWIIEMAEFSIECLYKSIKQALELSKQQSGYRTYTEGIKENLSWQAYGERYNENIKGILS